MTELTILTTKIRQLDGLYSLNDLHKAAGDSPKHKPLNFLRLDTTQELIAEISNCSDLSNYIPLKSERGKYGGTYVCRELVYAYAMWISAKFHLHVIRAFDAIYGQPAPKKSLPLSITPPVWTRPAASSSGNEVALNINTARTLIAELKTWTSSLPDDIGSPLWEALDDLNRLMIRGWTEVDEAMLKIEFASMHLKRWLGEGRKR